MKRTSIHQTPDVVGQTITISGRVTNLRARGKKLLFYTLQDETGELQVVSNSPIFERGDIVSVTGSLQHNPSVRSGVPGYELQHDPSLPVVVHFESTQQPPTSAIQRVNADIGLFRLKSEYLSVLRDSLRGLGFCEVVSPTIVSEAVDGPVPALAVHHNGESRYLTISNLLSHQELLATNMGPVYELGKVFRGNPANTSRQVTEVNMLDFSRPYESLEGVINVGSSLLHNVYDLVRRRGYTPSFELPESIPVVEYLDLIDGLSKDANVNLPVGTPTRIVRRYHDSAINLFGPVFWITHKPETEGSFFKKESSISPLTQSCELRVVSLGQLADGSEKETNPSKVREKMSSLGIDESHFNSYLSALSYGVPPNAGLGMGIDRTFLVLTNGGSDESKGIDEVIHYPVKW